MGILDGLPTWMVLPDEGFALRNVTTACGTDNCPLIPWYVAVICAPPNCTSLSSPLAVTVATAMFDDDHVASVVTSRTVLLDNIAVAVNWLVCPRIGTVPETAIEDVVGSVGLGLPHADVAMRSIASQTF